MLVDGQPLVGEEELEAALVTGVALAADQVSSLQLADLPGDQCLVAAHLASQVLQVQPALFVDKLQYMDVGRGQVEPLAIELALDACPHMLEDRHQRRHQVGVDGVVHWSGRVNLM